MNQIVRLPTFSYTWDEIGMTRDEYSALDDKARLKIIDKLESRLFTDIFCGYIPTLDKQWDVE